MFYSFLSPFSIFGMAEKSGNFPNFDLVIFSTGRAAISSLSFWIVPQTRPIFICRSSVGDSASTSERKKRDSGPKCPQFPTFLGNRRKIWEIVQKNGKIPRFLDDFPEKWEIVEKSGKLGNPKNFDRFW